MIQSNDAFGVCLEVTVGLIVLGTIVGTLLILVALFIWSRVRASGRYT